MLVVGVTLMAARPVGKPAPPPDPELIFGPESAHPADAPEAPKAKRRPAPEAAPVKSAPRPAPTAPATAMPAAHATTDCEACHATSSWTEVRFNHDRTGFPLTGQHAAVHCKRCHGTDYAKPQPKGCVSCHQDVHVQELGARCEGCHDTISWKSRLDVDAHRRTAFPLLGAHGALPCTECHFQAAERRFSRAALPCGACHALDYQRANQGAVDHARSGFDDQQCGSCHDAYRFTPARYPNHACFPLSGPHNLACANCHQSQRIARTNPAKACSTGTVNCVGCHTHDCSQPGNETDAIHRQKGVQGYGVTCSTVKCIACHGAR